MILNIEIAKRYLLGKKSTNAINYITWISVIGIAIGTAALILILSVFNGFQSFISEMYNAFNPDMIITPYEGKYFEVSDDQLAKISMIDGVLGVAETVEEVAIFDYKDIQKPGVIKGVDSNYRGVTGIDSSMTRGDFVLDADGVTYGVIGRVMSVNLSINPADKLTPMTVYMPLRERRSIASKMGKEFKSLSLYPSGVFTVSGDTDAQYVVTTIDFVSKLLGQEGKISALELALAANHDDKAVKAAIENILGAGYVLKNRFEQDAAFLRIMNIEKWISFLIVSMVLLIIAFNMVGSLWMMVLEKKKDIAILRSMGYDTSKIRGIFMWEGLLISGIGILIGIIIALLLYYLQKEHGLVGIPDGFMIDAYPIAIEWFDFVVVVCTVLSIGALASLLPAIRAGQVTASVRAE